MKFEFDSYYNQLNLCLISIRMNESCVFNFLTFPKYVFTFLPTWARSSHAQPVA